MLFKKRPIFIGKGCTSVEIRCTLAHSLKKDTLASQVDPNTLQRVLVGKRPIFIVKGRTSVERRRVFIEKRNMLIVKRSKLLGTYSKFARKSNFLALGVCFPHQPRTWWRRAQHHCLQQRMHIKIHVYLYVYLPKANLHDWELRYWVGCTKTNIRPRRQKLAPQKLPSQKFSSHLSFELVKARNINAGGSDGSFKLPRPAVGPVHVLLTSFGRENLTITWDSRPFSLSSGNFFGIQQAFLKALFAQILLSLRSWCTINFMLFWYVYIPAAFISNQKAASTPSN